MSFVKAVLAYFYGLGVYGRDFLFRLGVLRTVALPGVTISVGNIAVGGTGKTPVVMGIVEYLLKKYPQKSAGIVTRGYKSGLASNEWIVLVDGVIVACSHDRLRTEGVVRADEALMQSKRHLGVPVIVGARRYKAVMSWLSLGSPGVKVQPGIWILDDGFQHRQLRRPLDVVLLDAKNPYGSLLPKGRLREPVEALCRADVIGFTRASDVLPRAGDEAFLGVVAPNARIAKLAFVYGEPEHRSGPSNGMLPRDLGVTLVSGIAHPKQFKQAVVSLGFKVHSAIEFGDHEFFSVSDLTKRLGGAIGTIVTTEKDWARCEASFRALAQSVYILPVSVDITETLQQAIDAVL
jgi:tetraacyldisaccharide 4'-kinase